MEQRFFGEISRFRLAPFSAKSAWISPRSLLFYILLRFFEFSPSRKRSFCCRKAHLFGLYDTDGILRFTGRDKEACLAYADLFDLPPSSCSLMDLPDYEISLNAPNPSRRRRRLEVRNN